MPPTLGALLVQLSLSAAAPRGPYNPAAAGSTLSVVDFGAVGDGVTDCAPAIQRAIDQAQREYRALFVPAGIYRIETGLRVNRTQPSTAKYSPATPHWRVAPLRLIGEGATNGEGQSVIYAGRPMSAVLTFVSQQGNDNGTVPANLTENHSLEQLALDANDLANFSVYAPAITGSKWKSVSFVHGLVAGLYIGYGWIHNIEGCAFKGSGVAQLYLDRSVNSINVIDNNFAAADGVGIIANQGEAVRLVGNCFESLGGPAIYANQIGSLTISSSYYEANNLSPERFQWFGQPAVAQLCTDVVLNGAGNRTVGRWAEDEWATDPARLGSLVVRAPEWAAAKPRYAMRAQPLAGSSWYGAALIEGNYHNPDQSHCQGEQYYGVYVAGGDGVSVRYIDCRACSKRHPTQRCAMVGGGNVSNVEQARNTGDWA
jgi:hypothetical protein